ncbi:unnamed protein product [Heterobilharzia americana]|nr:unnamed protein product [Heterobilharzia americana]
MCIIVKLAWSAATDSCIKNRIEKLQSQLNSRTISHSEDLIYKPTEEDETFSGATSFGVSYLQDDNDLCTRKLYDTPSTLNRLTERDLTKSSEKQLQNDKRRLEDDLNSTKSKLQKTKQRVNSLLQERKELKQQIIFLVQKGKHDDELVESLVQRTGDLQRELTNMSHLNTEKEQDIEMLKQKLSSLEQRKDMEVGKLNEIIAEKNENMEKLNQLLTETKQKQLDELNRDMNEAEYDGKVKNNSSYTGSECELVSSFTIERNGFLTLVANMESRIGELLCQINTLEMQNAKLVRRNEEKQNSKTKISTAITSKHKTTNTSDNRANENDAVLDYLLHNDYLKDAISQCNLSAHSAKIITKRIKELQNALYNSQDEITSLKGSLKLTLYYRKEDLKLVMQMVDDIRRQNKNGAI